jgi:hypothetical protein
MRNAKLWLTRMLIVILTLVLCGAPEMAQAQAAAPPADSQVSQDAAAQQNQGIVDPSKGPLQPVPPAETLPSAPSATAPQNQTPAEQRAQESEQKEQPLGAAVGQQGVTTGGAASKPAGNAIAPAKQRQVRSLLIKLGALGAAGIAIGTVVALSKRSPSAPPNAR